MRSATVTQEEWEVVTGLNPSYFSRTGGGADAVIDISDADLKQFPVEQVSWDLCQLFIERLNQKEKNSGRVYRLPKEVEWEYACRGGPVDKLVSAFDFYFGMPTNALLPDQANFESPNSLKRTTKVGSYDANTLGLHDMHGNVWEWCEDVVINAEGVSTRMNRGGGWFNPATLCRTLVRNLSAPSEGYRGSGFRLALSAPAPSQPAEREKAK